MPLIRPISDLRNKFTEISILCHKIHEPIFITKKGHEDLVVMSHKTYEHQVALMDLYQKLGEAEAEERSGELGISHAQVIKHLRQRGKVKS